MTPLLWLITKRSELPFGDLPGIERIAEGIQSLPGVRAEPKEAQDLGDACMGEPNRPGERPLRPEIPGLLP
ncbi:MAG: hypothetical protein U9N73_10980 [Candidatus Auribacterota bacterium]|nr:hypothetical protein [Candidatus Auribacterota bacterium]